MNYDTMTVQDLRTACRERGIGSGTLIAGASKATLVEALQTGRWPQTTGPSPDAAQALAQALALMMPKQGIDEEAVRRIVREEIPAPPTIRIEIPGRPEVEIARQHERFPLLLQVLACGLNVLLVGPAGTGKTTAARKAAEALGLGFSCLSVGPQTSKSDLLGFVDAGGTYRESLFVQAYRDGGVFLLDEMDAGNAGVLTVLNAALAGDVMAIPVGMVARSPRFLTVAGANTYGQGASRQYVGRNQLDAATLDRFAVLDWPVDEGLEAVMVGLPAPAPALDVTRGGLLDAAGWLARVRAVRASVEREQIRAVVSPRATVAGVALLGAGVGRHWVEEMVLWRGMPADARARVEGGAK
jgi:cobaltochelatase CobS